MTEIKVIHDSAGIRSQSGNTALSQNRVPGLLSGDVDQAFFDPLPEDELRQWDSNPIFPPERYQTTYDR